MSRFKIISRAGGVAEVQLRGNLNKRERRELTNLLRRSLLYQQPKAGDDWPNDEEKPRDVLVKIKTPAYERIMELIRKAGGWDLGGDEKQALVEAHIERARRAYGDGDGNYDFTEMNHAELLGMWKELKGLSEMADFREALAGEIEARKAKSDGH